MLVIGIVGSRRRNTANDMVKLCSTMDRYLRENQVEKYRLVSGGCPKGADSFAESIAKIRGLSITIHYPEWSSFLC